MLENVEDDVNKQTMIEIYSLQFGKYVELVHTSNSSLCL